MDDEKYQELSDAEAQMFARRIMLLPPGARFAMYGLLLCFEDAERKLADAERKLATLRGELDRIDSDSRV